MMAIRDGIIYDSWDSRFSRRTRSGYPRLLGYYTPLRTDPNDYVIFEVSLVNQVF